MGRIQKKIALSSPIQHTSMGFGASEPSNIEAEMIMHRHPWLPNPALEDLLPIALMAQMEPIQLLVRLRPGGHQTENTLSPSQKLLIPVSIF